MINTVGFGKLSFIPAVVSVWYIFECLFEIYIPLNAFVDTIFQLFIWEPVKLVVVVVTVRGSENWPFLIILSVWKVRILAFADISESMLYRA